MVLALIGLVLGPLLGIVVDRIIDREGFAPVLRCPQCRSELGPPIPIVSWFARCPSDPSHRRRRYLTTDLLTAGLFAVAGARYGLSWQLWPILVVFAIFVVMAVTDWEHHLLVNELTGSAFAVAALAVLVLGGLNDFNEGIGPAFVAGAANLAFFGASYLVYPKGMGFGDVKLAPTLGLLMGWQVADTLEGISLTLTGMIIGLLSGGLVGVFLKWWNRNLTEEDIAARPDDWIPGEVPLGPFLIFGTIVMLATTPSVAL